MFSSHNQEHTPYSIASPSDLLLPQYPHPKKNFSPPPTNQSAELNLIGVNLGKGFNYFRSKLKKHVVIAKDWLLLDVSIHVAMI